MNRMGVALAADSAVTADVGNSSKVRDTAVKLFMLSKYRPVGVMVYNNSLLLSVPWETIIKLFRQEFGPRRCDTVIGYAEELIDYVERNTRRLFSEDVQDLYFAQALELEFEWIEQEASDEWQYEIGDGRQAGDEAEAELIERVIGRALARWESKANEHSSHFGDRLAQDLLSRNSGGINKVVGRVFAGWDLREAGVRGLREIAKLAVTKAHFVREQMSGLVIAGFGETEHFPAVQHLTIGGVYGDQLKLRWEPPEQVSEENPSSIMAFGDDEMVESFLFGARRGVLRRLDDAKAYIRELPIQALDVVPGLSAEQKAAATAIVREASERKATEFGERVLYECAVRAAETNRTVETLTVRELAHVASTLVGLGSFQKQMSQDRETVGGPVDVAVISKGDGFIWIDRKHYFDKKLNSHFFRNYYEEGAVQADHGAGGDEEDVDDGE